MGDYLTRDQILDADDLERRVVEVPEWGGRLLVRAMTGHERGQLEATALKQRGAGVAFQPQSLETVRARVVAMTAINENGDPVFTFRDVGALGKKSGKALERVFDVVAEISGITPEAITELVEGFEPGPRPDFGTD